MRKGSPYKYVAAVNTTAFKDAPEVIILGLSRLIWAAAIAARGGHVDLFNELLLVAYMAEMQMGVSPRISFETCGHLLMSFSGMMTVKPALGQLLLPYL